MLQVIYHSQNILLTSGHSGEKKKLQNCVVWPAHWATKDISVM